MSDTSGSSVKEISIPQGVLRVEVIAPHTFRIRLTPDGRFGPAVLERYGVLQSSAERPQLKVESDKKNHTFTTEAASLAVDATHGRITLRHADGRTLLRETADAWSAPGQGFGAEFALEPDERIYGLGDVSRDCLNRRGMNTRIWVKDVVSYVPIPYIMSSRGWGLLVNTTWKHEMDIGKERADRLCFGGNAGELDYYLFVGSDYASLLDRYTDISGKPTLLPLAAYGMTFVCNQQANARDMLDDCLNLRRAGIPCDWIGLEPGWMQKYDPAEQYINTYDFSLEKTWHKERFYIPHWIPKGPGTFIDAARRMGFKLSLWMCTDYDLSHEEERRAAGSGAVDETADKAGASRFHEDAVEHDVLLQTTVLMDKTTRPDEPWFEHLKKFVDQGAGAFKLDGALQVVEHPDRMWGNGMDDRQMHNLYPLIYGKQMHNGFLEHTSRRPMVYSAGGYTGIQQYVATWAGDTGGGAKPLVSLMNHGLSGHANTSCDMEVFSSAGIHFGFFQPWSQVCSWAYWRHPWMLGDELLPMFQFYSRLRYRLLPYIYSAAHEAYRSGMPIVRAMPLAFPEDARSDELLGQYMFGDAFLVTAFTDRLHLPAGRWIDYWTGQSCEGSQDLTYTPPAGRGGALFVRAGAIIPQWPQMDYVGQKPVDEITLEVFAGESSQFTLYEDDGVSFAYRQGGVATTHISSRRDGQSVTVEIAPRAGQYDGMPVKRSFKVLLHTDLAPRQVRINGKDAGAAASYDSAARVATIHAVEAPDRKSPVRLECGF